MPVKLADLFRTQNVRKRDRICIICIDMASVKCTLPPHIAENRIPLSSSNSSQKPGTACSAIRSGFSFSRKTRFGPFPGLMVSFINNLRVSLSYGSPSAMPFSIPKAGKINVLCTPSVLIPRTPRVPSSSGPLLTAPVRTRSGPPAAGCRPAPGSQPEAFLPLRVRRSRPAVRREGWRTRNCLPAEVPA